MVLMYISSSTTASVLLLLLGTFWCASCAEQQPRIPRLLHRNFMAGAAALEAATRDPQSGFKAHWLASCRIHNPGWREIIWDEAAVLDLIQQDFPWFLSTYLSYPKLVQRSDVMRYMVLYKYGGMYLDADVECYASVDESLRGKDLVLNCEYPGGWGQMHNAAMASAPGHPFWLAMLQEAMQRAPAAPAASISAGASAAWSGRLMQVLLWQLRQLWQRTPFHNKVNAVLKSTGPMLLTDVYQSYLQGAPACGSTAVVEGWVNHAYPLGSWYTPCLFRDDECQRTWAIQHFLLTPTQHGGQAVFLPSSHLQQSQQQQRQQQRWKHWRHRLRQYMKPGLQLKQPKVLQELQLLQPVIGIHHYSGSWTGWDHSQREQQQHALRQQASGNALEFFMDSPAFLQYKCSALLTADIGFVSEQSAATADSIIPLCMEHVDASSDGSYAMLTMFDPPAAAMFSDTSSSCSSLGSMQHYGRLSAQLQSTANVTGSSCDAIQGSSSHLPAWGLDRLMTESLVQQLGCHLVPIAPLAQQQTEVLSVNADLQPQLAGVTAAFSTSGYSNRSSRSQGLAQHAMQHVGPLEGLPTWQPHLDSVNQHQDTTAAAKDPDGPERYMLRLTCNDCQVSVLQQLFGLPAKQSRLAQQIGVLIMELAVAAPTDLGCNISGNVELSNCSQSASGGMKGLDDVYNLLHQQLGFVGFMRQKLSNGNLRLGWVRRPHYQHLKAPLDPSRQPLLQHLPQTNRMCSEMRRSTHRMH